jgi:ABC-type multidrug transport system fused ATPase/permease subunit
VQVLIIYLLYTNIIFIYLPLFYNNVTFICHYFMCDVVLLQEKKLYHFGAMWLTFFIVDMIQQAFGAFLFSILIYRFVELDLPFLTLFYPMMMFTALFASSVAMWCGLVNKNATSALAMFIVIAVFNMNFAGYLVTESQMKDWIDWLLPISFMRYAVGLLFNEIFSGVYVLGDVLVTLWDYGNMTLSKCLLISCAWFVGIQLLIVIALFPWPSRLKTFVSKEEACVEKPLALSNSQEEPSLNPLCECSEEAEEARMGSVQLSSLSAARPSTHPSSSPSSEIERVSEQGGMRRSMADRVSNVFDSDRASVASYVENRESLYVSTAKSSIPEDKRVIFSFQNMTYTIHVKGGREGKASSSAAKERELLCEVSGVVRPGEMMALMGPSGVRARSPISKHIILHSFVYQIHLYMYAFVCANNILPPCFNHTIRYVAEMLDIVHNIHTCYVGWKNNAAECISRTNQ